MSAHEAGAAGMRLGVVGDAQPGLQVVGTTCRPCGSCPASGWRGSAPWPASAARAGLRRPPRIITGSSIMTTDRYCLSLFFCIFSRLTSERVPSKTILQRELLLDDRGDHASRRRSCGWRRRRPRFPWPGRAGCAARLAPRWRHPQRRESCGGSADDGCGLGHVRLPFSREAAVLRKMPSARSTSVQR